MPYITCTKRKSHKVHITVCEKCKGVKCPDYRDYIQPTLFQSLVQDKSLRKAVKIKKIKPTPILDGPEQLILNM